MDRVPEPEPGSSSPPAFATTAGDSNLKDMSVSELVTVVRTAALTEDFDAVEEVLVSRFSKLEQVVRPLQDKLESEMLRRKHAEEELNKREEECVRGKKAQDNYEKLLKNVKGAGGLAAKHDVLRKKNAELEAELKEMKEMKDKWIIDSIALAEVRKMLSVLEDEKLNFRDTLVAVTRKNSELEEAGKKDLATMEELRVENRKLAEERRGAEELVESLERQFGELNGRVARLEDDTRILMNADGGGGNIEEEDDPPADIRASFGVNDEEDIGDYECGSDTVGTIKRNEDTHHSPAGVTAAQTSSKGSKDAGDRIVKLENDVEIINLDDSDDDDDGSKHLHGKKALSGITFKNEPQSLSGEVHQKNTAAFELLKRKMPFSDSSSSSSSSSDDELDVDNLLISSAFNKRSKT